MEHTKVLIIGAGLSGINMAARLRQSLPDMDLMITEARAALGGTWDVFRYPGVRSDSDMFTLGYPFRPWSDGRAIADGAAILEYIRATAHEYGLEGKIRYGKRAVQAEWSADTSRWTVTFQDKTQLAADFVVLAAGYYNTEEGYTPEFPGRETFSGQWIHPQSWHSGVQYANRRVVIIGSGATAVTLAPVLAKDAARVTVLQRTPTYIIALPSVDPLGMMVKKLVPERFFHSFMRTKNLCGAMAVFLFCRLFPGRARRLLLAFVKKKTGSNDLVKEHFTPPYDPWEQRLCVAPDGDFFSAVRSGKVEMVTDGIERVTGEGLLLKSGRQIEADVVVCATGFNLRLAGDIKLLINGAEKKISSLVPYKTAMLSGVPNLAMIFGYTNSSWTLKSDLISRWLVRVLKYMQRHHYSVWEPEVPDVPTKPFVDFSSGYVRRSEHLLPQQGASGPWRVHQNYLLDWLQYFVRPLKDRGLRFR